jgi:nucleoporin NUP42
MWKGRPVKYVNDHPCYLHPQDNTTLVRVNFPSGPPDPASLRDSQGKPEEYTPEVAEAYEFYLNNGYFKDAIPSVPPKREWISFDF